MQAHNRTLPQWLERIRWRQITLPRFQRFEAWTHQQIAGLLDTVLQGLPAGAVLILEVGSEELFQSRTMMGAPTGGERVTEQLLDGQQRLTALWRTLNNDYSDRSYFVQVKEDEEAGTPYSIKSWQRWEKGGGLYPEWLNNPTRLWNEKLIPIHLLRPDTSAINELKIWARQATGEDHDAREELSDAAQELRRKFEQFNIPYLSLPVKTPKETALNVFIQMNTSATQLSTFDVVVAQVEAEAEKSLHELVSDLKADAPGVEWYVMPDDLMLSVGALLQDKVPTNQSFLSKGFSKKLIEDWDTITKGIRRAVAFLEEERVLDGKRLPTDVVVAPLAALWALAPEGLDAEGRSRTLLRKYFWRACFSDRYERTSATRALVDFRELKNAMSGSDAVPLIFNENEHPLPAIEQIKNAGWPVRKDRLPRALLALSLRAGGYDLADGSTVTRDNLQKREYHHLYPVALLSSQKVEKQISCALNCALVTWKTNRNISAKTPEKYLAERREGTNLGEEEVRRRLDSHLVPLDELSAGDYDAFLEARAQRMYSVMQKLCAGQIV